ncbi:MAG: DUF4124 domain-containing protein [Gammaproteobacteria bacterium]|nr:DUF4124 domain-containing protein [Gammaproteobacteria bacterium]
MYRIFSALLGSFLLVSVTQAGIKKCQDETGQWHYGDRASEACEQSKIIEMSDSGHKTGEVAAPPTAEELAEEERRKDELAKQKKREEEEARRDALLVTTYGHENDIMYVRDRKLSQVEHSIEASQATLKSLNATLDRQKKQKDSEENIKHTEDQITKHSAVIEKKREEQEALRKQYDEELKRYRELKTAGGEPQTAEAPAIQTPNP